MKGIIACLLCMESCMTSPAGCRGVVWDEDSQKWAVCLSPGDGAVEKQLGLFTTEEAAAGAYDALAVELWGPSTPTNFHSQGTDTGVYKHDKTARDAWGMQERCVGALLRMSFCCKLESDYSLRGPQQLDPPPPSCPCSEDTKG